MVWKVYERMVEKRVYPNEATVRIMTSALCKEGELQKVIFFVDRIHGKRCSPMVIVNTSLILRMMEQGNVEKEMLLMKRLLQKNMIFDTISFSLIVFATVKKGELKSAWEVYQEMLNRGFKTNSFAFIGGYCKRGLVDEAGNLMQEMRNMGLKPYEETYNHLIAGCDKAEKWSVEFVFVDLTVIFITGLACVLGTTCGAPADLLICDDKDVYIVKSSNFCETGMLQLV